MKLEARFLKRFGILLSLLLITASVVAASSSQVELSDDAYHFPCFDDGQHDINFVEWWYFNFYDTATASKNTPHGSGSSRGVDEPGPLCAGARYAASGKSFPPNQPNNPNMALMMPFIMSPTIRMTKA